MPCKWNKIQTVLVSLRALASEEQSRLNSEGLTVEDNLC